MVSVPVTEDALPAPVGVERLRQAAVDHFQFIWRSLRRLGLRDDLVDDAAQQVFEVAARKLERIQYGSERAFLFKTALLVATEYRRVSARSRARTDDACDPDALAASSPDPEAAAGLLERRRLLDAMLDEMPLELRTVFVLFELEGLSSDEIAELIGIPVGTAASRLRRSREEFHAAARRVRARLSFRGGSQ
jgi:RNA polymerase sigma-70 factor (ECF subfamily)